MQESQFHNQIMELAITLLTQLQSKKLTLATAESVTGGLLGHYITNVVGSSQTYIGGVICYSAYSKNSELNVSFDLINEFGTISPEVTGALLDGLKSSFEADMCIAITGIAGTEKLEGKPSGLTYIGIGSRICNKIEEINFEGSRIEIKHLAVKRAFEFLLEELENI